MQFYDHREPVDEGTPPLKAILLMVLGLSAIVFIVYAFMNANSLSNKPLGSSVSSDTPFRVEYRVFGTAGDVDVNYENQTGGNENRNGVKLPWAFSFQREPSEWLYVSAYNWGDSGRLTCEIWLDGVVQETQSISGGGSVQCSGRWKR